MASKANLKSSGREAALARRRAMSNAGKQGVKSNTRERSAAARPSQVARQTASKAAATPRPAPTSAPAPAFFTAPPATAAMTTLVSPSAASNRSTARPARAGSVPATPALASRSLAQQRRDTLSRQGRKAVRGGDRTRVGARAPAAASQASRKDCGCGCNGDCKGNQANRTNGNGLAGVSLASLAHNPGPPRQAGASSSFGTSLGNGNGNGNGGQRNKRADAALATKPTGRLLSQSRRAALSGRGKSAAKAPQSVASLARQTNPTLSGRELAQQVRTQRSSNGGIGATKPRPAGRVRPNRAPASDQPWKVGVSETAAGQVVTGTKVGRSVRTTGDEPSTCRVVTGTEYMGADIFREFCQSEPPAGTPKVRVSPTGQGNRVTGNEVGRSTKVTGDEPGTCKSITGTEYLSPEQVGAFCGVAPEPGPRKVGITRTFGGHAVSGNLVGRSTKVTGDEHGANIRPTGTQYTAPADIGTPVVAKGGFSVVGGAVGVGSTADGTGEARVPPKVATTNTLSGGTVTGTRVGRSERVTGDEPGSCRLVTGDEYLDLGHFQSFCGIEPRPEPAKVGTSRTLKGQRVSGTQAGRSSKVTGDEPGTCKIVTGTPYAGLEQVDAFCEAPARDAIVARSRPTSVMPTNRMTGIQPGIDRPRGDGGKVSGAHRGACEPVTGTPYIGADQFAAACGPAVTDAGPNLGKGALPGQPDFPRALDGSAWEQFSVTSPVREMAAERAAARAVTGTSYESNRHITGPFGMGTGKITGTEQFRFDGPRSGGMLAPNDPPAGQGNPTGDALPGTQPGTQPAAVGRVTGEGQSAGGKVTGDDWDRGDRVTGTEGRSARRRNPTRPGPLGAMPAVERKRNEDVPPPVSRVTGSAGSSARGSLVTYSGGARG